MSSDRHRRERRNSGEHDRNAQTQFSAHTNSKDPILINSRVFVGNLPTDKMDRKTLLSMFKKYGTVIGVSLLNGYGFVQFEHEDDARASVETENGSVIPGTSARIDVKMAAEGRRQQQEQNQRRAISLARGGRGVGDPFSDRRRDRDRDRSRSPLFDRRPSASEARRLPPLEDRRDPFRRVPLRDMLDRRDAYPRDREGERFPRAPSPFYTPLPPPPPPHLDNIFRPPYECEIILTTAALRSYAESIETELKPHGMMVKHNVVKLEAEIPKAVEELSHLKVPYAIILGQTNELHRSMTLNILHGTPQEHRNMPLEDAVKLIIRTFKVYVQELRQKATTPKVRPDFLPPDKHTTYLFNLLADNRILNLDEINHVMGYLEKRRQDLMDKRPIAGTVPSDPIVIPERTPIGMGSIGASNTPAIYSGVPAVSTAASINFNNPSVQKALDDLMQAGRPSRIPPGSGGGYSNLSTDRGGDVRGAAMRGVDMNMAGGGGYRDMPREMPRDMPREMLRDMPRF